MSRATMKFVTTSDPIDLRGWEIDKACAAQMTLLLRDVFDKDLPSLFLPLIWAFSDDPSDGVGGPAPTDPLMIYLTLPLATDEDCNCCFSCSLESVLDDFIQSHANQTDKVAGNVGRMLCAKVSARLRELAQKVDDACEPPLFGKGAAL